MGHFLLKSTGLEYARIEWGGSHSVLATGGIQNLWVLPFCQDRMAAAPHLEVLNPFYPGKRRNPEYPGKKSMKSDGKNGKKTMKKDKKTVKNG